MPDTQTINATEFKAKCLDILERLGDRRLERVIITKRGRAVAILTPPEAEAQAVQDIHGFMRGGVHIPAELDLTEPVCDEPFSADLGQLHG